MFMRFSLAIVLLTLTQQSWCRSVDATVFYETDHGYFFDRQTAVGWQHVYLAKLNQNMELLLEKDGKRLYRVFLQFYDVSEQERQMVKATIPDWQDRNLYRQEIRAVEDCRFNKGLDGRIKAVLDSTTAGVTFQNQKTLCSFQVLIQDSQNNREILQNAFDQGDLVTSGLEAYHIAVTGSQGEIDPKALHGHLIESGLSDQLLSRDKAVFLLGAGLTKQLDPKGFNLVLEDHRPIVSSLLAKLYQNSSPSQFELRPLLDLNQATSIELVERTTYDIQL